MHQFFWQKKKSYWKVKYPLNTKSHKNLSNFLLCSAILPIRTSRIGQRVIVSVENVFSKDHHFCAHE